MALALLISGLLFYSAHCSCGKSVVALGIDGFRGDRMPETSPLYLLSRWAEEF